MKIQVLDHGYVELIETWGTGRDGNCRTDGDKFDTDYEVGIIEAARQSTQGSFRGWKAAKCDCGSTVQWQHQKSCVMLQNPGEAKLLAYLYNNQHYTPFEFAGMILEVQAPIFVFREWHRHRTQSYNEMSARYAPLPDLYYHASIDNVIERALVKTVNKQAGTVAVPSHTFSQDVAQWLLMDEQLSVVLEAHYQKGLAIGIPKELARKKMPVDHYSRMRSAANLRNWLGFLTLRTDTKAQWEIQQYAWAVAEIVKEKFPRTMELWTEREWT